MNGTSLCLTNCVSSKACEYSAGLCGRVNEQHMAVWLTASAVRTFDDAIDDRSEGLIMVHDFRARSLCHDHCCRHVSGTIYLCLGMLIS